MFVEATDKQVQPPQRRERPQFLGELIDLVIIILVGSWIRRVVRIVRLIALKIVKSRD